MVDDGQGRLTCYDSVVAFRDVIPVESSRHPLEGGVILCSLFEISEKDTPRLRVRHNDMMKADITAVAAREMYDFLKRFDRFRSLEDAAEREKSLPDVEGRRLEELAQGFSLSELFMPPIQQTVGNLFAEVLKLARYRRNPKTVFSEFGGRIDRGIEQLYVANGLPVMSEQRSTPDLFRARVIEYEFFARIVHDIYCRQRGGK